MRKQNYNNKAKHRSAWLALVLLMITALPITAQNALKAGDRFQGEGGILWYEVVDATKHTVKVTYENPNATTQEAREQNVGRDYQDTGNKDYKGYYGKLNGEITIPETVKDAASTQWKVVAIGTCAFINERGFFEIPKGKEKEKKIPGSINITVNLPSTIEHIEEAAFYQAYACTINFPEGLKTIGRKAFYKAVVGGYFQYNYANKRAGARFVKIKINPPCILGPTAIGPQAFEECSTNRSVTLICNKISYLGYQAFKGSGFVEMKVPASANLGKQPTDPEITAMYADLPGVDMESGAEAFTQYNKDVVTLEEGITTIPKGMFENAFKELKKFNIPLSVT